VRDYVGYTRGGHQFKFGIDVNHLQTSVRLGNTRRLVIFPNLASFFGPNACSSPALFGGEGHDRDGVASCGPFRANAVASDTATDTESRPSV
jgi:hypothetical protein